MTNPDNVGGQYDRELIALMLEVYASTHEAPMWPLHRESTIREQVKLLRDADSAEAARVRTLSRAAPAGGDEEDEKCSWCGHPRSSNALSHDSLCRVRTHPQSEIARRELAYREPVSAPAGSGEVDGLADTLVRMADNAYCDYIRKMQRPECLGWEEKVRRGSFDSENLRAHVGAGELLGRHRALHEAAALLRKLQQGAEC